MRLTVLGKSPSWQDAGGACSGYLVRAGDTTVLIDCGNGVFAKLREQIDYLEVDAVVISHFHADHVLDLAPFAYALTYSPRRQPVAVGEYPAVENPFVPPLYLPPGGIVRVRDLVDAWGGEDLINRAFDTREYRAQSVVEVGPVEIGAMPVPHFVETYALDVRFGDSRFTYSADCSYSEALVEAARDTPLLIAEATVPHPERERPRGHMTPAEAGSVAAQANAARLVLTHISDEFDWEDAVAAAASEFDGPVEVARAGGHYEL